LRRIPFTVQRRDMKHMRASESYEIHLRL